MKNYFLSIILSMYTVFSYAQDPAYPATPAAPLNIVAAESFIDTDPGIGNGTAISIAAAVNISNATPVINVTGLGNGVHRLYIRTSNNEGRWSITNFKDFLYDADPVYRSAPAAPQNIIAAEYFIDTDPGFGSGTPIAVIAGVNVNNVAVNVNTSGLQNGNHRLYIRSKNNEGSWSLAEVKDFLIDFNFNYPASPAAAQNVVAAEYFFDTDPGFGNAVSVSVAAGIDLNSIAATINTTGLTTGTHRLYFRSKNQEGKWSVTQVNEFIINNDISYPAAPAIAQNIVAAEYFFDSDPGFGNGISIAVAAGTDLNSIATTINATGLTLGTHRLYFRSKNQEGKWSVTQVSEFIINNDFSYPAAPAVAQNITAAEYFIDADPGFGSANRIPVTPGVDINNLSVTVSTTGLSTGLHRLYIRTKNQEGRWSIVVKDTFATSLISVSADTLLFGNTPLNTTLVKNLVITNASASNQTINTVVTHPPFSINFTGNITLTPGQSATLPVSFIPVSVTSYNDSVIIGTSAGNFKTMLRGAGISQTASWTIDPAAGYDFGNVAINTTANTNFVIRNTGNIDIALSNIIINDLAFTPSFTAGAVIAASASLTVPVAFTPTSVNQYSAQLKIKSSAVAVDSVTTIVKGNGFAPGTPPVLLYTTASPYSGLVGVNPSVGATGLFTYKILYKSANNKAPQTGYPKVGIDLNGDGDFVDLDEGTYTMTKEGSSTDYISGVVYRYTFNLNSERSTAGYQFFANDEDGNTAATIDNLYKSGPVVTNQQLDLKIFASDISFSNSNPLPGQVFSMTANVANSTAIPATNVPVKFYRDTILIGSAVIPAVNAFSSSSITQTLSFAAEGFFPIKVWIDSSRTLGESNVLNNYAIRPVIVGSPNLPGGITVTSSASIQQCPQLTVIISGNAVYFGTGSPTAVAGAEVTINTGAQTIKTTTDANGNYSYALTGVPCDVNFSYSVTITDFTFTSQPLTNTMAMPCPAPNACVAPPSQGGINVGISTSQCSNLVGSSANVNFVIKYRERDISNMWSLFDEITKDTLKVFQDGVLVQTLVSTDGSHGPGDQRIIPVSFPLSSINPVTITGELSYTYVEYLQIPTSIYHGMLTKIITHGGGGIQPELNLPDLTIQGFAQTGFTAFNFTDANIKCGPAGAHKVLVFDSIPGGSITLIKTSNISSLGGGQGATISFSDNSMSPGLHKIKIVTDADGTVAEQDETNNVFIGDLVVTAPDLTVTKIITDPSALTTGATTRFTATIKNTGKTTGSFVVSFLVNNVPVGVTKTVTLLEEKSSVDVVSDLYTVTSAASTCGELIQVIADANSQVSESDETNNVLQERLSADLVPLMLSSEEGSVARPVIVRVNTTNEFFPAIRNLGHRDASAVTAKYLLNGTIVGEGNLGDVRAGVLYAAYGSFTHTFTTAGDYIVNVIADTLNTVCESDEGNNAGTFHIRVVDSKADFEVLSQYISPSSLNPNAAQSITIVGTVKNMGGKATTANVLRFLVDDIQLGLDVPINALQPGKDTTVAATATYSSNIAGVKVMKIVADPNNTLTEEREDNNEATRTMIVGDAPDMARSHAGAIRFNPGGFAAGDSVTVSYSVKNNGVQGGTAWARFLIYNAAGGLTAIDSVQFTLAAGDNAVLNKKMLFSITQGTVITEIVNCSPLEFDLLNNNDTLAFSTVAKLKNNTTITADLDMKAALPDMLPGWVGGKLVLEDYDLIVNGVILNFDTARFVITNGIGRLKFVNNNAENVFPVGTSLNSTNFVKINNAGVQDNFAVSVAPYVLQSGNNGDTLRSGYVNRTWFIDEQTMGGSNAAVTFYWNTADEQNGFDRTKSRTAHYTSSWQLGDIGNATTEAADHFSKSQNGYNSFSPFTVTSVNAALPLHLLQFTAIAKENTALLKWQTTNEVNTSHFVIQHSTTGLQFEDIGTVASNNSSAVNNYTFTHTALSEGPHYYRLRMVDIDGRFTYSEVKLIKIEISLLLQVYPNPAQQFVVAGGLEANGTVTLATLDGKLVRQLNTTGNTLRIELGNLAGGMYILSYTNHGKTQLQKIVKE